MSESIPSIDPGAPVRRQAIAAADRVRQLGLRFLIAWMACTCAYLAWIRDHFENSQPLAVVLMLLVASLIGATWGGRLVMSWNRWTLGPCRRSPGEWLIVARAMPLLLAVLWQAVPSEAASQSTLLAAILLAFTSCMLGLASLASHGREWRIAWLLLVTLHLFRMAVVLWPWNVSMSVPGGAGLWHHIASAAIVAVAAWTTRRTASGSLHWLGVWLWLLWELAFLTGSVAWTLEVTTRVFR